MPREFTRSERVSDAVQKELAILISENIRDPRVGMVSVTEVSVSRDLAVANVYITFVGERTQEQIDQGLEALNGAAGYLRKSLSSSISMRATPKLKFFFDISGHRAQHLDALIDFAVTSNATSNNGDA
jgi:ribosome-binding factor A